MNNYYRQFRLFSVIIEPDRAGLPVGEAFHTLYNVYIYIYPPSPHRLFDLQDSLYKRIHFPPQLSDFVPLRNGFYSVREQTD